MKINMLTSDLIVSGGRQKLTLRLYLELSLMGHDVLILTPVINKKDCYPEIFNSNPDIKIRSLYRDNSRKNGFSEKLHRIFQQFTPATFKYLYLMRKRQECDLLIIHNEECLGCLIFIKKGIKVLWMMNNQISNNLTSVWKNFLENIRSINNIKVLPYILFNLPKNMIDSFFMIKGLKYVNSIACYDKHNQTLTKRRINRESVNVHMGADIKDYTKVRSAKINSKNNIKILSIGVLSPYRRYEDIIAAVYMLRKNNFNASLSIVGRTDFATPYYAKLQRLIKKYNLFEQVIFYEYLNERDLSDLYSRSHVFCFANDANTWGIAAFEAMATGMPVIISSNIGGATLVENRKTGWVVPPRNPKAIFDALVEIVNKPHQTKAILKASKTTVLKEITWKNFANRILAAAVV